LRASIEPPYEDFAVQLKDIPNAKHVQSLLKKQNSKEIQVFRLAVAPEDINLYLDYVYAGKTAAQITSNHPIELEDQLKKNRLEILRINIPAGQLGDIVTCNAMIGLIMDTFIITQDDDQQYPIGIDVIKLLWKFTPKDCNMRQLVIDFINTGPKDSIMKIKDLLSKEIVLDLWLRFDVEGAWLRDVAHYLQNE
jgi:hypothetical protein